MIADLDSEARSDLVLPLTGGNLCVGSRDVDAGMEAGSVMGVSDDPAEAVAGSSRAVVRALLSWVPILRPAKRPGREFTESTEHLILLFDTVPGLFIFVLVPDLGCDMAEVGKSGDESLVGGVFPGKGLAHDKNIVSLSERVGEVSDGLQSDLRIFCGGLPAGRAIVVPVGNIFDTLDLFVEGSALRAESGTGSVNPDVLGYDLSSLVTALLDVVSFLERGGVGFYHNF
jgi:hypothetical protein